MDGAISSSGHSSRHELHGLVSVVLAVSTTPGQNEVPSCQECAVRSMHDHRGGCIVLEETTGNCAGVDSCVCGDTQR